MPSCWPLQSPEPALTWRCHSWYKTPSCGSGLHLGSQENGVTWLDRGDVLRTSLAPQYIASRCSTQLRDDPLRPPGPPGPCLLVRAIKLIPSLLSLVQSSQMPRMDAEHDLLSAPGFLPTLRGETWFHAFSCSVQWMTDRSNCLAGVELKEGRARATCPHRAPLQGSPPATGTGQVPATPPSWVPRASGLSPLAGKR